jgi:hypothetical protein
MERQSHKLNSQNDCSLDRVAAEDLLGEYEDRILSGDHPDLDEYVGRYRGPDPHNFRIELQLATALLLAGQQRRVAAN